MRSDEDMVRLFVFIYSILIPGNPRSPVAELTIVLETDLSGLLAKLFCPPSSRYQRDVIRVL